MRFIGSKEQLLSFIEDSFVRTVGRGNYLVGDVFCGTAVVSRLFKKMGHRVIANDNLKFGYVFAQAALKVSSEPRFDALLESCEISKGPNNSLYNSPYEKVLSFLNSLPKRDGFFCREYSPGRAKISGIERRYFSNDNAGRIDAIRSKILEWRQKKVLKETEHCLLLADLMRAANRVANIAGTYGCFMKHWEPRALRPLRLERSPITPGTSNHKVFCTDANKLVKEMEFDVLYLDPPYTWRHYGAYYHILETIANEDEPEVSGKTGLRPWQKTRSIYCDRENAINGLRDIVNSTKTKHLFLSYNSEGLITNEQIIEVLNNRGEAHCNEIEYRRYRSNKGGSLHNHLKERLFYVKIK